MHDILVNTVDFEHWSPDAQYATRLAALLQAAITGVFVYPSPFYATPGFVAPELTEAVLEASRVLEASALAAKQPFIDWAKGMGIPQASWMVAQGSLSDTLVRIACWHDLLVLQRDPERTWSTPADLAELILAVGVPCIVVPPRPVAKVALSRIVVAWNGAPEAIRAVHAALPLLQRADEVLLLRGATREPLQDVAWKPPFDIDAYLGRHGVHPRSQDLVDTARGVGDALLEQTDRFRADLLVMGAYGRSRFSEWALGGATRHVLWNAQLPVLFRH